MPKKLIRRLQTGFGLSLLILIVSALASYISIQNQIKARDQVLETERIIANLNQILVDLQNAETAQRGFYLTSAITFLEPYYSTIASLPTLLEETRDMVKKAPLQAARIDTISDLANKKLAILTSLEEVVRAGGSVTTAQLETGKAYMDSCREVIARLIRTEKLQLDSQIAKMNRVTGNTSLFVLAAALLSLIITIFFYFRIRRELGKRESLQAELRQKDATIALRLQAVRDVARTISQGDYTVRVTDSEHDSLGEIAASLNEMTKNLEKSFEEINHAEWRQGGMARLSEIMVGNKKEDVIARHSLTHLVDYPECLNGSFYLFENRRLIRKSTYGLEKWMQNSYEPGEGIVGQVFLNRKIKIWENATGDDQFIATSSAGNIRLKSIIWIPLITDGECLGVIELGGSNTFQKHEIAFFKDSCSIIALELIAAKSRRELQIALEETQAQAEELQTQHSELENLNTELEAQTQKLQASEEELKVQQEELLQTNLELEEHFKLLEEKNTLIAGRNLEIQRKAEELALSTRYKSEFLANMSHELRTPLNSILLLSRLLSENTEENLTVDQIESARVIQSSGSSLLSLIDEILDLSKIEAGKMELDYQRTSLANLVKRLSDLFAPMITQKQLSFNVGTDDNLPDYIETDQLRLEQILRNLIANAIKFTAQGVVSVWISRTPGKAGFLSFAVQDTGIGISSENQKIVFEAFQQADGSTRRKFGGTGLGLSISREIARLLGGEITLVSTPGEGSTFTLSLPLDKETAISARSETVLPLPAAIKKTRGDSENTPETSYIVPDIPEEIEDDRDHIRESDRVILIVEDDTHFAKALLGYSRRRGYKGIVVVRGDQVLPMIERHHPSAILLDIQLPVVDGWQVMDKLKTNPNTRHIPVHIMSSLNFKKESLMRGAIDFIDKPVALDQIGDIFKKIEEALTQNPKKVLIVEENSKHAKALSYFLDNFNIASEIKTDVEESVQTLLNNEVRCVILDMAVPDVVGYKTLEAIKQRQGLEELPIIIFTGKNLSNAEELKIRQYADSIVIKTVHSFQRILDEVGLFLHLVEEGGNEAQKKKTNRLGSLVQVLSNKTVLIADDDVRNIFSLTKTLEMYQMKVISGVNGKEALQQLQNNPDTAIILMDMMMPEMDGYETIRQIRRMPDFAHLPIISVTAKAMTGEREKCILAGASDYISKPVDKDQLLSLLRVWLYEL